jgi:hypothetical protein
VRPTAQFAKSASTAKTGRFATLGALLHVRGSGASKPSSRRLVLSVLATTLAGALSFSAAPALAADGHGLTNSFGSAKSTVRDPEPLSDPTGIAVNEKTKEIDVIDGSHNRVERFNASGAYEGQFDGSETPAGEFASPNAIAVDNDPSSASYGDMYVSDAGHNAVDKFGPEGKYSGYQLTEATTGISLADLMGIAVDPLGALWAAEGNEGGVYEFADAASNNFSVHEREEQPFNTTTAGIAIDSKKNIYIVDSFFKKALKLEPGTPSRGFAGLTNCGCATGVAVDAATNNVYTDQGTSVAEYAPFGEPFGEPIEPAFGSGALEGGTAIAVSATHTVYVVDSKANDVDVFTEGPKPTLPATESPEPIEGISATLKGKLEGGESSYHFSYNTNGTCEIGSTTPATTATDSENVSVKVTGLAAKTKYTYCLLAENKYGHEAGSPITFETTSSVPLVENTSSSVKLVGASLSASVNPEHEASTCVFQYGKTEAYGQETPCGAEVGAIGEGTAPVPVSGKVAGLEPGTTYDYRVLASNVTGEQPGPNATFTTEPLTPTQVETAQASDITATGAAIGGQLNPEGGSTYYIEYGSPTCSLSGVANFAWWLCASKSSEAGPLTGDTVQNITPIQITGLTPATTYSYWIVAHNVNGTERGEEATFTTASAPTSTAATQPAAVVPAPPIIAPPVPVKPSIRKKTATEEKAAKLSMALKQCHKDKSRAKRKSCEAGARKRYGPKTKPKPQPRKGGK